MSGEQFALAEAVERLREIRRTPSNHRVIVISAADPLNLAGIVTSGDRVRAVTGTSLAYRDGAPIDVTKNTSLKSEVSSQKVLQT
jgi:ATP-dependent Lhr-like helicase